MLLVISSSQWGSVCSTLVSKDLSTGATASSYDSIFVCNPKLLLLTLALLAKKTHKYSWIKFHWEITSNRVSSDPHVDCHVPNQVHIPVNFAVYFSYTRKWQDITKTCLTLSNIMQHTFLNYSIFINVSGFKQCSIKSMEKCQDHQLFFEIPSPDCQGLIQWLKIKVYWDFALQ